MAAPAKMHASVTSPPAENLLSSQAPPQAKAMTMMTNWTPRWE